MKNTASHHHSGHDHQRLISILLECEQACEVCMSACIDEADVTVLAHCIELDRDCSEICMLGAKLLMRDSELAHKFLLMCEDACRACMGECSKHEHEHCKKCAEACHKCAEACHEHIGNVKLTDAFYFFNTDWNA
jgi:hypothetical protein